MTRNRYMDQKTPARKQNEHKDERGIKQLPAAQRGNCDRWKNRPEEPRMPFKYANGMNATKRQCDGQPINRRSTWMRYILDDKRKSQR